MSKFRFKRVAIFSVAVVVVIIAFVMAQQKRSSLDVPYRGIERISIFDDFMVPEDGDGLLTGSAEIVDLGAIREVVQVINSIKLYPEKDLVDELPGDSPTTRVYLFRNQTDEVRDERYLIYFYDDIVFVRGDLLYNLFTGDGYYRIKMSEYEKLQSIVESYGS